MKTNKSRSTVSLFSVVFLVFAFVIGVPATAEDENAGNTSTAGESPGVNATDEATGQTPGTGAGSGSTGQTSGTGAASGSSSQESETRFDEFEAKPAETKSEIDDKILDPNKKFDDIISKYDSLDKDFNLALFVALIAAMIFVILIIVLFLLVIRTSITVKQKTEKIRTGFSQFGDWKNDIDEKVKNLENHRGVSSGSSGTHYTDQNEIEAINKRISKLEKGQQNFEANVKRQADEQLRERQEEQAIKNGRLDPLTTFNRWAVAPSGNLPDAFCYINGEPRIRTVQQFSESRSPAKWITNRIGEVKYILPNPNFFDQRTDGGELYNMDLGALKPKGQNRMEIVKPCEISDAGFIESRGELRIL